MSKALFRLKEKIEIEFLKSKTYTEINDMFNQMKHKIDKAESELNKLTMPVVSNWVAVKDSLPLVVGFYTVHKPTKPYVLGLYFDSDQNFRYDKQVHKNITHWQKLPEPPCS